MRNGKNSRSGTSVEDRQTASKSEVIEAIAELFSEENFTDRHVNYILKWVRYYTDKSMIRDMTANDISQNVVKSFLSGKRKWYKEKPFKEIIFMATYSYIRNELQRVEKLDIEFGYDEAENNDDDSEKERRKRVNLH